MYKILVLWLLVSGLGGCSSLPSTDKRTFRHSLHGIQRIDNYHWLKDVDRKDPDVLEHLETENRVTDSHLQETEDLQKEIYDEFIGRLKEADSSVPFLYKGFYYYHRTEAGKSHKVYCRKKGDLNAAEQVLLDMNSVAANMKNASLGSFHISPDQSILAYSVDEKGEEIYQIFFKGNYSPLKSDFLQVMWS